VHITSWSVRTSIPAAQISEAAARWRQADPVDFAGLLLRLRGRTALSQRDVAVRLGIHVRSVQLWEAGASHPNAQRLQALISMFLDAGGFPIGLEQTEAAALWAAADAESNRLKALFDERWFTELLVERSARFGYPKPQPATSRTRQYWGDAPDVAGFLGRETERETLRGWIQDGRTRVVAMVGMGGIGKTLLGARTAVDLTAVFECVYWRSLRNAPPFDDWLGATIGFLSPNETRPADSEGARLERLLELLRDVPCLLVLDNFESVLQPGARVGRYRPGYEGYGALIQHLAQSTHQSRLLLTSREEPPELGPLKGDTTEVRVLALSGLEVRESKALLRDKGLQGDSAAWEELIERYAGNGLALKLVGESIRELFGGSLAAYLADLQMGPGAVFGGVRKLLDSQLQRLSDPEQHLLRWLAIEREPLSFAELALGLGRGLQRGDTREAVEALLRRSLLVRRERGPTFTPHPVVLEYVTERIVADVADELAACELASLRRLPLLKAVAKDYVRTSQERLLVAPLLDQLIVNLGSRRAAEQRLVDVLDMLRALSFKEQGYAPGNIVNLLRLLNGHLRGLDLRGLNVRQVYLQEVEAQDANLTGVHLSESVLAEAFEYTGALALSADGDYLAAGTTSGDVCLWRVADRTLHVVGVGPTRELWGLGLSADGERLACGGLDGTIRLWDVATGAYLAVGRGHTGGVRAVALSGDGRLIASGGDDGTLRLWDGSTAAPLATSDAHAGGVSRVAAGADARLVASCGVDGKVRLWDGRNGVCLAVLAGHVGRLYSVALTRDSELVISGGVDGTVRVWETRSGKLRASLSGHNGVVQSVAASRDGRIVASAGADGTLRLWDGVTATPLAVLQRHLGGVRGVAVSDSGHMVASVGDDGTILLWESSTGEVLATLQGYTGWLRDVALSQDSRWLIGAGNDGRVRVWDAARGACIATLRGHVGGVWAVALSHDRGMLASGGDDGTVRLWNLPSGDSRAVLHGHHGGVWRVTTSGDGHLVASGGIDGTLRLWDGDGASRGTVQAHAGGVRAAALSADASLLASGGMEGIVKLWPTDGELQPAALLGHTGLVRAVAVTANGSLVASGGADGTVRLWESSSGRTLWTLHGQVGVRAVALSHDGSRLATGGDDGLLRLWSTASGTCLATMSGHTGRIWGVALSGDSQSIASGGADGVLRLWNDCGLAPAQCFRADRPYERMDITGLTGVTAAQRVALVELGAVERLHWAQDEAQPTRLRARRLAAN
jgi:WD40 repeat protein/transcriptional regulator with XRE-family HTH domain